MRVEKVLQVSKLLQDEDGAQRPRGIEHFVCYGASLVLPSLSHQYSNQNQLSECSASLSIRRPKGYDTSSEPLRILKLLQPVHAPGGLSGQ